MTTAFAWIVWTVWLSAVGLSAPAAGAEGVAPEPQLAMGELSATTLTVSPAFGFEKAILRVAGPDGYEALVWSEGEPLTVDLLANGSLSVSDVSGGGPPAAVALAVLPNGDYAYEAVFHLAGGARQAHDGAFVVENGFVRAPGRERGVARRDGRVIQQKSEEQREGVVRTVAAVTNANDAVEVDDLAGDGNTYLYLASDLAESWYVETQADGDLDLSSLHPSFLQPTLTLRPNGDVSVRERRLGIGTTVPQADLHIFSPSGNVRIADSDPCPNPNAAWEIEESSGSLIFEVVSNCAGDSVGVKTVLQGNGNVGIGTTSPQAKLHVAGSGIIDGDVALGSSRTFKHAIEPVDTRDVLDTIRELPIYSWKYRDDPVQAPHVGPMAEDVHAAFRLGRDEKHLSPADSAGLALAAIQGLDTRLDRELGELRARNAGLVAENAALRTKLLEIEERLGVVAAALAGESTRDRAASAAGASEE